MISEQFDALNRRVDDLQRAANDIDSNSARGAIDTAAEIISELVNLCVDLAGRVEDLEEKVKAQ